MRQIALWLIWDEAESWRVVVMRGSLDDTQSCPDNPRLLGDLPRLCVGSSRRFTKPMIKATAFN
jgi:hypothetical protein